MSVARFPAVVATGDGPATTQVLTDDDLPPGDVTVDVAYSSLNYKDGLAVTGRAKIARRFPMVCGIDLAGTVSESSTDEWKVGDEVVVTGWGLSETHPGGYTQRERLDAASLLRPPSRLGLRRSMAVGTAGLTAMLCVLALEDAGIRPGPDVDVLVTGASGGVGSIAVALLSRLGYRVAASTGRPELEPFLRSLGATTMVERDELAASPARPLLTERFTAAVETVGGSTLANVLAQIGYRGAVASCGNAGGSELATSVFPFILRNVALLGVDSNRCPNDRRAAAWGRIVTDLPHEVLDSVTEVRPMSTISASADDILAGSVRGRVVVDPYA
ncbi:MAG TPA: MDR family oxidoreductase [Acidimicrobiales bacterium]|nr:MDR family oxidoreductase [Acidimicrobiales bacterium]